MNDLIPATGALQSNYDARTITHDVAMAGVPLVKGGYTYGPSDIDHQHKVGICTAIHLTQNAKKYFGVQFSPDFQYLLQKKYYDAPGWTEGSSIFNALKVGKNFGFLPIELFTYVTENDRYLPYADYVAKLKAIPDAEVKRLIGLCTHKLSGYAAVDVTDPQLIAKAITDSKTGILCRYTAGSTWWTAKDGHSSWATADIDPLRKPTESLSGHAIGMCAFDYTVNLTQTLCNTWGTTWNDQNQGNAHVNWNDYALEEAWIPYYDFVPPVPPYTHNFQKDLNYNDRNDEVLALQKALSTLGYFILIPTGWYGNVTSDAVLKFQIDKVKLSMYERYILRGTKVGPKTRDALNALFNH